MNQRQMTVDDLTENGFELKREGKKHSIYWNPVTGQTIPVKRHDFNEDDRRYILKEAGIKKKK